MTVMLPKLSTLDRVTRGEKDRGGRRAGRGCPPGLPGHQHGSDGVAIHGQGADEQRERQQHGRGGRRGRAGGQEEGERGRQEGTRGHEEAEEHERGAGPWSYPGWSTWR